jgi:hypothetical protein
MRLERNIKQDNSRIHHSQSATREQYQLFSTYISYETASTLCLITSNL